MRHPRGIFSCILLIVMGLFLFSCQNKKDKSPTGTKETTTTSQTDGSRLLLRDSSAAGGMVLESPDGLFIATFPDQPMYHTQLVPVASDVKVEMVSYIYEKSVNESFMISYCDYPEQALKDDPFEMLETARSGAVLNNIVESEFKSEVDGWPAITTKSIDKETGYYYILRVILAKNRLYQIQMLNKDRYSSDEAVKMFMDAFTVTMAH